MRHCFFLMLLGFPALALGEDSGPLGFGPARMERELETDRPDFTEGTQTIEAGHLQLEGGYTFVFDDSSGTEVESHSIPELLLRLGLGERLEGRIAWEGYLHEEIEDEAVIDESESGISDMSIGLKQQLYAEGETLPSLSVIPELGLPVGSSSFTSDHVEPALKLLWAKGLTERSSVAGNVNFTFPVVDDDRYFELASSITVAMDITAAVGAYIEYFGFYPDDTDVDVTTRHFLNGGLTFGASEDVQLDVRVGCGLNDAAEDFFTGVGFAFRM